MEKDSVTLLNFLRLCRVVSCFVSAHSSHSFTGTITKYSPCYQINNLLAFPSALNQLAFSSMPPSRLRKIALFVKKWPHRSQATRHSICTFTFRNQLLLAIWTKL
ncbi:hypothetical protein ACFXTI_005942 [Malus domestica]